MFIKKKINKKSTQWAIKFKGSGKIQGLFKAFVDC